MPLVFSFPRTLSPCWLSSPGACLRSIVLLSCTELSKGSHQGLKGQRTMASEKPIRVAIIGLGFGAEFIPIYQKYPGAHIHAICRRERKGLDECGDRYGIKARYTDYREVLKDPEVDAVHINSPIPDHAWM